MIQPAIEIVSTEQQFQKMLAEINGAQLLSIDTEFTTLAIHDATLLLISLYAGNIAYVLDMTILPMRRTLDQLKPILENPAVIKIAHNATIEYKILYHASKGNRIEMVNMHDTMIVDRMLFAGLQFIGNEKIRYGLKDLVTRYLHIDIDKEIRKSFTEWTPDTIFSREQLEYSAMDVVYPYMIMQQQMQRVKELNLDRIYRLEMNILPATAMMEYTGVYFNRATLEQMIAPFERFIKTADKAVQDVFIEYGAANRLTFTKDGYYTLNADSNDQVLEALHTIGIDIPSLDAKKVQRWDMQQRYKKRQIKKWEIDYHELIEDEDVADALDLYLILDNKILRALTFLKGARKLLSTYVLGIIDAISTTTNRVHPNFNSYGAQATGRYSSTRPNLQNLPNDKKLKLLGLGEYSLRKAIEAPEGRRLIISDYSGQELVVLAVNSGDTHLLELILKGDVHSYVARHVLKYNEITKENKKDHPHKLWRDAAKVLSFGIAYGTTGRNIAETMNIMLGSVGFKITQQEGDALIEKWFELFPQTKAYLYSNADKAILEGYVIDAWGRRRQWDLAEVRSDKWRKLAAMREAQNMPIQSSSATMVKRAIELIWQELDRSQARIIITVHDEIVVESTREYLRKAVCIIKRCMEQALADVLPSIADQIGMYEGTSVSPKISRRYDK